MLEMDLVRDVAQVLEQESLIETSLLGLVARICQRQTLLTTVQLSESGLLLSVHTPTKVISKTVSYDKLVEDGVDAVKEALKEMRGRGCA